MKKLSKTLLAIAAISVASMAMTASAMAAMEASYTDGVVTVSGITDKGASQTLLVVPKGAETVTQDNIYQIDQEDGTAEVPATFEDNEIKLDVSRLTPGATYEVRIGGTNGTVDTAEFTVPSGEDPEPGPGTEITIMLGDVNSDNMIMADDAADVATKAVPMETATNGNVDKAYNYVSGLETAPTSETIMLGDVNLDGMIMADDATDVATKAVPMETATNGNVGVTVTVTEVTE